MTLLFLGGLELVFLGLLAWWPGPGMPFPGLLFFTGGFVVYAAAGMRLAPDPPAARSGRADRAGRPGPTDASTLTIVWGVAVLLRLALLPVTPELSDDVFRYLWDGHVQLQGVNPYRFAPSDPALTDLRTSWHDQINNPDIPTIYPPVAQVAFLAIALVGGGILQAKIAWIGLDLLTGWVLFRVARETGRPGIRVLVLYLWCPLLVVETAWSAHLEPLGLLAMALLLHLRGRPGWAGAAGAGAVLTKFAPVAALPAVVRRLGARFAAGFALGVLLLHLPYLGAGAEIWEGLFTYARDWRFMEGPFYVLEAVFPGRWPPRLAAAALVLSVVGWATLRRFSPERALFWTLGAGLLLSPTVHPWYVLWILPFAALRASGPWILLSGLAFLGYWGLGSFLASGVWPQPTWLRLLVWTPPLAWLALQGLAAPADVGRPGKAREREGEIPGAEDE